jgi:epoxyqueuosine reductase
METDAEKFAAAVKSRALSLGFDRVGIASAEPSHYRDYFRQWLDDGRAGTMGYLNARFGERCDPGAYLPGAASVICVALNYFAPLSAAPGGGRVARYALGDDYHDILKPRLHALADWLGGQFPHARFRCAVDTAPVMEKELAARAGVGWMGKNTCIINEEIGSWLFLGEVLTTLTLPPDQPAVDRCGTCTRCLEACPTQAITGPYQLDATRCISYLTIEHSGDIAAELSGKLSGWVYGCDICQDVCPFNRKAVGTLEPRLAPRFAGGVLDLGEVQAWTPKDYQSKLRRSAMKRVKLPVLQRNARLVADEKRAGAAERSAAPAHGEHGLDGAPGGRGG